MDVNYPRPANDISTASRVRAVARELPGRWREHRVAGEAAEIAFFGLLSLLPGLLALAAALGSIESVLGRAVATDAEAAITNFLQRVLTQDAKPTVDAVRGLFADRNPGLLTIGTTVALVTASRAFVSLIDALDLAADVRDRRSRLQRRLTAIALSVLSAIVGALLLSALVLGPLLGAGHDVAAALNKGDAFATMWDWARWPLIAAALVAFAATLLHLGPDHRRSWRSDLVGAAFAATAWAIASLGVQFYLSVAGRSNAVLGSLGGALILAIWLYLLSIVLLLAAEINAAIAATRPATCSGIDASAMPTEPGSSTTVSQCQASASTPSTPARDAADDSQL